MKKLLSILLLVLFNLMLISCDKTELYEIAMITDYGSITDQSFNQSTWEAVKAYAEENNKTYAYYKPSEDSNAARVSKIEQAIEMGAKVVIMPGYTFSNSIYEVQDEYKDVNFIALDVNKADVYDAFYNHDENGNQTDLKDKNNEPHLSANVMCIIFQEEEAGYLAGYAAVKNGERNLGFLGGMAVPSVQRFGYGFIQGINDAANELNVKINLWYIYAGQFYGDNTVTAAMEAWMTDGCETVFACGGGVYTSVVSAIQTKGKETGKLIGVDSDQSKTVTEVKVLTSAIKGLKDATDSALDSIYMKLQNNESWNDGGKEIRYGLKTSNEKEYVGLPKDTWSMENYTLEMYSATVKDIREGKIEISSDTTKSPKDFLGENIIIKGNNFGGSLK